MESRPAGGCAKSDPDVTIIEVADSGAGVPVDAAETIFDRSSRADGDARAGLGIGLAIVAAIARAHGGSSALEPTATGSTFALTLPGYRPAAGEVAYEAAATAS